MRRRGGRALSALTAVSLLAASCTGGEAATTTTSSVTVSPTTAQTTSTTAGTSAPSSTSTAPSTSQPPLCGGFRQVADDTDEYSYSIAYPVAVCDEAGALIPINLMAIEDFVAESIEAVIAAAAVLDAKATFTAQIAPELLNDDVYSVSGVATRFLDAGTGTVSFRHGWIINRADGSEINAAALFLDGDLTALADAAQAHLITDVLGSEEALTGPDGLLPVPANFEAVWLTSTGIGVGFYEGQVAARAVGSPAVLIPFSELDPFLDKTGVLAPLEAEDTLPEL